MKKFSVVLPNQVVFCMVEADGWAIAEGALYFFKDDASGIRVDDWAFAAGAWLQVFETPHDLPKV